MFDLAVVSLPAPTLGQIVRFLFSFSVLDGAAEAVLRFPCWVKSRMRVVSSLGAGVGRSQKCLSKSLSKLGVIDAF